MQPFYPYFTDLNTPQNDHVCIKWMEPSDPIPQRADTFVYVHLLLPVAQRTRLLEFNARHDLAKQMQDILSS